MQRKMIFDVTVFSELCFYCFADVNCLHRKQAAAFSFCLSTRFKPTLFNKTTITVSAK